MLTTIELQLLQQLGEGRRTIAELAEALQKSPKQGQRIASALQQKGFLQQQRGRITLLRTPLLNLLLRLLATYPPLVDVLGNSGFPVLASLLEPKAVEEIILETGLRKSIIYQKLQAAERLNIVKIARKQYSINMAIWPDLAELLREYALWSATVDERLPADAMIYHKTKEQIIFSTREQLDLPKTAFSAYGQQGIPLFLPRNYYLFPSGTITRRDILQHSLYVVMKEKTIYHLLYLAIFYIKFKKTLIRFRHPLLESITQILQGKSLPGFPSLREIKEKMEVYA